MYVALDLSKYIISKCVRDGHPISNLQLQKILYYIQVYFLKHDNIAFPDAIEAWTCGSQCLLLLLRVWGNAHYFHA